MPAIKSSANKVLVNIGDTQSHQVLHKRCDLLVRVVSKIHKVINEGNDNQDNIGALMYDDDDEEDNGDDEEDVVDVRGMVTTDKNSPILEGD